MTETAVLIRTGRSVSRQKQDAQQSCRSRQPEIEARVDRRGKPEDRTGKHCGSWADLPYHRKTPDRATSVRFLLGKIAVANVYGIHDNPRYVWALSGGLNLNKLGSSLGTIYKMK